MNAIRDILYESVRTGQLPEREAVTDIMRHGTLAEREELRRGIHRAALKIRNLQESDDHIDLEDEIEDVIGGTAEKYARLVEPGRDGGEPAPELQSSGDTEGIEQRRRKAMAERKRREPLREILMGAGYAGGVDPRDLDALTLRADISDDERQKWRTDVVAAGRRIVRKYEGGMFGEADQLAEDLSERLAGGLAETLPHRDPLADVEDPRALADAILRRGQG